ncbi:MAG: Arginyl-tRNA synthetase [Bacteroidota bacterium]
MNKINQILFPYVVQAVSQSFEVELPEQSVQFQDTRKEFEGDTTLVVFPITKFVKQSPEQLGSVIGEYLVAHCPEVKGFNVVKGFLNLVIVDGYWFQAFQWMLKQDKWGWQAEDSKPRIMVEYSSPNTNKPLHLGHLRNNFLGYSVAEILKASGHKVTKVQIINDRGIHICKSMYAWQLSGKQETPETSGLKGDKLVGKYYVAFDQQYKSEVAQLMAEGKSKEEAENQAPSMLAAQEMLRQWEQGNPEVTALWKMMNQWVYAGFDITYRNMGVNFDKLYFESETYLKGKEEVEKGLSKGVFFQKEDGSTWIDLTSEGLDEKAVLRKDGTAMYITQDIGTAILRFEDFPDTAAQIYTVGNEQEYHFKVLFKILAKLGWKQSDACHHLSYGMVELPEGKMKSREGTVVDADDLMDSMKEESRLMAEEQGKLDGLTPQEKEATYQKIGMAALKYFLLRVDPKKNMMFNPQESIDFNGHTGPFIQYGYVRTQALLRKANWNVANQDWLMESVNMGAEERALIQLLYAYPDYLDQAVKKYDPSVMASFAYELCKAFNVFYQHCNILREENSDLKNYRLHLTDLTGKCIASSMRLLGIEMPEKM